MDINPDEDADAYETVSPASGEQAGVVHDEDQREFQETPVPDAVRRSEQLEMQQRIPRFGALESGTERAPTQNVTASLAGISTGGAVGTVPEFVQQLKEWTLAQGERLGNGVQQLDDTTGLDILAQLPDRSDDAVCSHWNRLQESSNGHLAATAEQSPPKQDAVIQAQRWVAGEGECKGTQIAGQRTAGTAATNAVASVDEDGLTNAGNRWTQSTLNRPPPVSSGWAGEVGAPSGSHEMRRGQLSLSAARERSLQVAQRVEPAASWEECCAVLEHFRQRAELVLQERRAREVKWVAEQEEAAAAEQQHVQQPTISSPLTLPYLSRLSQPSCCQPWAIDICTAISSCPRLTPWLTSPHTCVPAAISVLQLAIVHAGTRGHSDHVTVGGGVRWLVAQHAHAR